MPEVLFVSGAATGRIRSPHPCLLLAADHGPFQVGRWRGLIYPTLSLSSFAFYATGGRVCLGLREISRFSLGAASKLTERSLVPRAFG